MESKESMKSKYNIGDLVSHRYNRPSLFGMVMKVYKTKSKKSEYSVSWLNEQGRSRCTEGILEIIKAA
tara:strand:- start:954 stop:1157 length:204 start_codon:yes stop_codon:yes gene_type:complete